MFLLLFWWSTLKRSKTASAFSKVSVFIHAHEKCCVFWNLYHPMQVCDKIHVVYPKLDCKRVVFFLRWSVIPWIFLRSMVIRMHAVFERKVCSECENGEWDWRETLISRLAEARAHPREKKSTVLQSNPKLNLFLYPSFAFACMRVDCKTVVFFCVGLSNKRSGASVKTESGTGESKVSK